MDIRKFVGATGIAAVAVVVATGTAIPASAANDIKPFGVPESLEDVYGNPMITYTVQGLRPSSDAVFHNGRLYEATVTSDGGIPVAALFNARAESGQNYRIVGGGIPGKIYFDVVGDTPNSVVYNDGVQDLMVWVSTSGANQGIGPAGPGDTSEIIGGAPTDVGAGQGPSEPAAPEVVVPPPFQLTEPDVAQPGFNAGSGGGRR
ncbi:DUF1942 domain-containing protein [Mycolicibacterium sp. 050158]|jgi:Domain of unknown function (DUF1942)|uniref:DUF1942 domain-containing protein n=1 Tax=Mycolicibacterium sp. 050158 TaxID=3090602 RepID=UPI00299DA2AC|nr:DUF1942 domain-containing protein [Mycolicibacterium sp. 050158]MDX1889191.1 DUF1942 domain-containing protein [Mycolicibacterium sp. 050158]